VRLILSALAGLVTIYAVAFALQIAFKGSLVFGYYRDVFGLAPLIAQAVDPSYMAHQDLYFESEGVLGRWVDFLVMIGVWGVLFAALYFRFVFRGRQTI
jgi:hypothetical protein